MSDESDAELELGLHDDEEPNLIATRQRRGNAGNRLQALLQAEEPLDDEDNIFMEFEDDDDFEEGVGEDMEDEESDEEEDDDDDAPPQQGPAHRDVEPKSRKRKAEVLEDDENFSSSESSDDNDDQEPEDAGEEELQKQQRQERRKKDEIKKRKMFEIKTLTARVSKNKSDKKETARHRTTAADLMDKSRRVSKRSAAVRNTKAVIERLKESEKRRASLPQQPKKKTVKKLTQEERLAEAKITERKNTASLNRYFELEEARKQRQRAAMLARRKPMRNVIRYISTTKLVPPRRIYTRPKIEVITAIKHEKEQTEEENPENGELVKISEATQNGQDSLEHGDDAINTTNELGADVRTNGGDATEGQTADSATGVNDKVEADESPKLEDSPSGKGTNLLPGDEDPQETEDLQETEVQQETEDHQETEVQQGTEDHQETEDPHAIIKVSESTAIEVDTTEKSQSPSPASSKEPDQNDEVDHEGDVEMGDVSVDSIEPNNDQVEENSHDETLNSMRSEDQPDGKDESMEVTVESPSAEAVTSVLADVRNAIEDATTEEAKPDEPTEKSVAFADEMSVDVENKDIEGDTGPADTSELLETDPASKEAEGSKSPSEQKHGHFDASQVEAPEAYMPHSGRRNAKARRASHHAEPHIFPGLPDVQGPYAMRQRNTITLLNFDDELAYTKYKVKAILFGNQALQSQPKLQTGKPHIPTTTTTVSSTGEIIVKERATSYYDPLEVFLQQQSRTCTITGKLAKFSDPDTGIKYATLDAFSMIQLVKEGHLTWNSALGGCYRGSVGEKHAAGVPPGFAAPTLIESDDPSSSKAAVPTSTSES